MRKEPSRSEGQALERFFTNIAMYYHVREERVLDIATSIRYIIIRCMYKLESM